jgi:hypothetical protein
MGNEMALSASLFFGASTAMTTRDDQKNDQKTKTTRRRR